MFYSRENQHKELNILTLSNENQKPKPEEAESKQMN